MQHKYRFMEWLDISGNGMLDECAILKKTPQGDIFFFPMSALDSIDMQRFKSIITHPEASMYDELWKLLEQKTLGNGVNALVYYNQLVRQLATNGTILPFGSNKQSAFQVPISTQPKPEDSFESVTKTQSPLKPKV